jgi:sulfate adenylyltransferase
VIFTSLLTYSRYAGPREAIFTAIVRRNYGCSHFIVGRDHTGVKDFYGKYDSQKIFSKFKDARIEILCFNEPYYCKKCDQITTSKTCPHRKKYHLEISGTRIRKAILNKSKIPEIYIRKDILKKLQNTRDIFVNRQEKIEK